MNKFWILRKVSPAPIVLNSGFGSQTTVLNFGLGSRTTELIFMLGSPTTVLNFGLGFQTTALNFWLGSRTTLLLGLVVSRYAEIAATWLQVARQVQMYFILAGSFCPDLRIKCSEIAILVIYRNEFGLQVDFYFIKILSAGSFYG